MATLWQRRRKAAREAGAYHAEGGPDTRAHHAALGQDCADAYDDAYKDSVRFREEQAAAANHPLTTIKREADALYWRSNDGDVMGLARLIESLADYILEKEQNP